MARRRAAPKSDAQEFAEGLPTAFLQCRDYGHSWRPYTASWSSEQACWERALKCIRCTAERTQRLSRSGEILRGHYVYPEGYLHAPGLGRLTGQDRDALRLESTVRVATGTRDGEARAS